MSPRAPKKVPTQADVDKLLDGLVAKFHRAGYKHPRLQAQNHIYRWLNTHIVAHSPAEHAEYARAERKKRGPK